MKYTFIKYILLAVIVLLRSQNVHAAYVFYGQLKYEILSWQDRTVAVYDIGDPRYKYMESVDIPAKIIDQSITYKVTSIADNAFRRCSKLASVTIPNSVTTIGERAFYECSSLTSVTIPNSVTSIGIRAFKCRVTVDLENMYYSSIDGVLYSKDVSVLFSCPSVAQTITIPNSVTTIEDYAFKGCSSLTSVTIPNSVTTIGERAFYNCSSLTSVTIPNSVTTIGESVFDCCSSLTSVTIPNSVTSIGKRAFFLCHKIATVYCQSILPPQDCPERDLFSDVALANAILYVPKGRLSAYEAVDPWRNFFNIEEMEFAGVDNVGNDNGTVVTADGDAINLGTETRYVEVYNIGGQCVFQGITNRIESLAKGVYIVKVGTVATKVII